MTKSRQEICHDIKFKSQHCKARRLCRDSQNIMLRGNYVATKVEKNYKKNVTTQNFMSRHNEELKAEIFVM